MTPASQTALPDWHNDSAEEGGGIDGVHGAIGAPMARLEDPILVRGHGAYTDDVTLPGQAYAAFVRSAYGHGIIRGIDREAALAMPGVLAIYTVDDLKAAGYATFRTRIQAVNADGAPFFQPPRMALAESKVRFVGDPVACVIASSAAEAIDAAEAVVVDIDPLPEVTTPRAALAPDAPCVYDELGSNRSLHFHYGDADAVAAAFGRAAHVTRMRLVSNRVVASPMEPRSIVADFDAATRRFTVYSPTQGVAGFRKQVSNHLKVPEANVRVVSRNVGGSFGQKSSLYPEYVCALHGARELNRPVKWTSSRSEGFLSDFHGRDHDTDAELALDADGNFLAVRITVHANQGAWLTNPGPNPSTGNAVKNIVGVYRTPLIEVTTLCAFTHTQPIAAYRGAGRPEGNYYMERLIDMAAREMGMDRLELRRRNHIRPEQFPYKAPSGMTYDSGEFTALLDRALVVADLEGYPARKAASETRGRLRGLGIGQFLETTAPVNPELGAIRFEPGGKVALASGTHDHGQGHWIAFAQVIADKLGIPVGDISLMQTDSDRIPTGTGTGGSKSIMAASAAYTEASAIVIEKAKKAASHFLEASVEDLEFSRGDVKVVGTDRKLKLTEIAERLAEAGEDLPPDVPRSLDVEHVSKSYPSTFPNGCHICEVEIDPDTGTVEIDRYVGVNDFGVIVNPLLVAGQVHGGVVQGIGQCLMEDTRYGDGGQLISASFTDYAMPRADNLPFFETHSRPVPATTNPLGVKGCGEAGCAGAMTSVMSAVTDALAQRGVRHLDMPATPLRVWQALNGQLSEG